MRAGTGSWGYTIVETMIFLAISGLMFIVAATFINGKQAKAELNQGINGINSTVQGVINDVSNGTYDSQGNFKCTSSPSGLSFANTSSNQGTDGLLNAAGGCTFLGKVIEFGDGANTAAYEVYTVAGSQYAGGSTGPSSPTSFKDAMPKAVDPNSIGGSSNANLTVKNLLLSGMAVTSASVIGGCNINAIGFFGSFSKYNGTTSNGSAQSVYVVPYCGSTGDDSPTTIGRINNWASPSIYPATPATSTNVKVCFDGGKGNYAALTIGGTSGQGLTTSQAVSTSQGSIGC